MSDVMKILITLAPSLRMTYMYQNTTRYAMNMHNYYMSIKIIILKMPLASDTLREACHGISLINVFVSVTTQWTDLAPTFLDTQPEEKL